MVNGLGGGLDMVVELAFNSIGSVVQLALFFVMVQWFLLGLFVVHLYFCIVFNSCGFRTKFFSSIYCFNQAIKALNSKLKTVLIDQS